MFIFSAVNTYNLANASDDAHNYVIAGNGYSSIYTNFNAAISIGDTNDTSRGKAYRAPDDGMQTIPIKMAEHFEKLGGRYGSIYISVIYQCSSHFLQLHFL